MPPPAWYAFVFVLLFKAISGSVLVGICLAKNMFFCWPSYRFKHKRGGSRTRSCSGPSFSAHRIGSEGTIHPHLLAVSVPSALSNVDPISIETISSDDNAVFRGLKHKYETKNRFLKQPKKSAQSRTMQKIKMWKESRSGSLSSSEDLQRGVGKTSRKIFSDSRKSGGRSYSSSAMLSTPIQDLQIFGSVPPTPTFNDDSHFKISSNGSGFRNKSVTLPNGSNFVSLFDKMATERFSQSVANDDWFSKSTDPITDCPCSSCKEKRWIGVTGSHYQFPSRSNSDWTTVEQRQRKGFYYNSNPAVGFEHEPPEIPLRKANYNKHQMTCTESSAFVYANLGAIQNANGKIIKSKTMHDPIGEFSRYHRKSVSDQDKEEFLSLPKNAMHSPFRHQCQTQRTVSDSECNLSANVLCPCCGNVFYYNLSKEIARANLGRRGRATLSEPATPTNFKRDNPLHDIFKASKLLSLIPSPEFPPDELPDYLKPNKSEQTGEGQADNCISPKMSTKELTQMSEVQLLYLVPPPQCHSPEATPKFNNYENGEYWRSKHQSNGPDIQMNYITYVRSDSGGANQLEISKDSTNQSDPDNESKSSPENPSTPKEEISEIKANLTSGVDVTKYEIKKDRVDQSNPSIYLRPRPQIPAPSFPYVWLHSSENETEDSLQCSKFGSKKPAFSRLPPLKENVAFETKHRPAKSDLPAF